MTRSLPVVLSILLAGPALARPGPQPGGAWVPAPRPSLYDPHPVPARGTWLEGYYTRVVDPASGLSLAVLAGTCAGSAGRAGYAALLVQRPGAARLEVHEAFPTESGFALPSGPPRRAPDVRSPPRFRWSAPEVGWFTQDEVRFRFPDGAEVELRLGAPLPWSRRGPDPGPEGAFVHLPFLTQHWFVHSVASPCRWTLRLPGQPALQGEGLAHQEKNWGADFPGDWVWSQGLSGRPGADDFVQLALAGGQAELRAGQGAWRQPAWLLGAELGGRVVAFRSPLDRFQSEADAAQGRLRLTAESEAARLTVELTAPPSSFAPVSVPSALGFRPGAVESFAARAELELSLRGPGGDWRPAARARLDGAALEFGRLDASLSRD